MIRSPKTGRLSLSRAAGALCVSSACFIGVFGILTDREHSGVVASLAVGAGVALIVRDRRPPDAPLEGHPE